MDLDVLGGLTGALKVQGVRAVTGGMHAYTRPTVAVLLGYLALFAVLLVTLTQATPDVTASGPAYTPAAPTVVTLAVPASRR